MTQELVCSNSSSSQDAMWSHLKHARHICKKCFQWKQNEDFQRWLLLRILAGATGRAHEDEELNVEQAPGQQAGAKSTTPAPENAGGPARGAEVIEYHEEQWNVGFWQ